MHAISKILSKYADKYNLFKIYKAFIEFDKSKKSQKDIDKAESILSSIYCYDCNYSDNDVIDHFLALMSKQNIVGDLEEITNRSLPIAIPLWLVLKYPNILDHAYGRWSLGVNANCSIKDLPSFKLFEKHIIEATGNYWCYYRGSLAIDKIASSYNMKNIISFAPGLY